MFSAASTSRSSSSSLAEPKDVKLFGSVEGSAWRRCVIVAPGREANVYFVCTAYTVSPKDFAEARGSGRAAPWPPEEGNPGGRTYRAW